MIEPRAFASALVQSNTKRRGAGFSAWFAFRSMIKYSVMYPNKPGARFDHTYYLEKHMPLVKERMGKYLQSYTIDKGVAGGAPGEPAPYIVICNLVCKSVDDFRAGFGPHAKEIRDDVANYTDIAPTTQMNEVVVG